MPVYEYECKACGRDFEYQQRMSDPDKTTCEVCGGALDRLISRTAFSLKGGGWYKDLYASPKPEKAANGDKANGTADPGKSDGAAATTAKSDATASSSSSSGGGSSGGGSSGGSSSGGGSSGGGSSGSSSTSAAAAKAT